MAQARFLFRTLALIAAFSVTLSTVASAQHGSGEPGIASFLSAVNSVSDEIRALNAEKNVTVNDIHVVSVQKLSNPGNAATLTRAIAKNGAQIAALRDAIKGNAAITAKLTASGISVDQVVAMDVQPGAEIHIFYQ
jgi:ABC-type transporter Mla subunit MlaD